MPTKITSIPFDSGALWKCTAQHNTIPFSSDLDRRVLCSFLNLIICLFLLRIQASLRSSCTELCAYKTTEHISNSITTMSVLINIKEIVSSSDSTPSNSLCLHCLFEREKNARFCIRVQNSTYRILNGETFYNTVSFFGWLYSNVRCAMRSKWIFYRIIICDERAREINGPKQWICSPFIVKMKNENRNMKMISLCCFDCFVHSIILHIFYTTQFSAETIYLLLKKTLSILYIENRLNENALFSSQ